MSKWPRLPQPDIRTRYWGCADHRPVCHRLMTDYEFLDEITFDTPVLIRIPAGFHYDGASVPHLVRSVLDNDDLKGVGPLLHDALYRYGGDLPVGWLRPEERRFYTRREVDYLFKWVLEQDAVDEWRENFAWLGVRLGGWRAWDSRKKQGGR
jgi:hypothetical protein